MRDGSWRPQVDEVYLHRNGYFYVILAIAEHTETYALMVVYTRINNGAFGKANYVRPLMTLPQMRGAGFADRDITGNYRFQKVGDHWRRYRW